MLTDANTRLQYRPGTYDPQIIRERNTYRPLQLSPTDRVLDVGACLGSFTYYAIRECQVANYLGFEPDPDNFALLQTNVDVLMRHESLTGRLSVVQAALTRVWPPSSFPDSPFRVPFYANQGMNKGMHSTVRRRARPQTIVWAFDFESTLEAYQPTALKVDVEGAEFDLLGVVPPTPSQPIPAPPLTLPSSIQSLAIEIHRNRYAWRHYQDLLVTHVESQGFAPVHPPRQSGWATLAIWRR